MVRERQHQLAYSPRMEKCTTTRSYTCQWSPESKSLSRWSTRTIQISEDTNMKWREWIVALVALTLVIGISYASRGRAEGEEWLQWSDDVRVQYLSNYLAAFSHGFHTACETMQEAGTTHKPKEAPIEVCMSNLPRYSKTLDLYADEITQFYRQYSSDRFATVQEIMDCLSDSRGLSLQQIHEDLGKRIPHSQAGKPTSVSPPVERP